MPTNTKRKLILRAAIGYRTVSSIDIEDFTDTVSLERLIDDRNWNHKSGTEVIKETRSSEYNIEQLLGKIGYK